MENNQTNSITEYFKNAKSITIIKNDEKFSYVKGDDKFEELLSALQNVTKDAHEMPAYGVSLDSDTKQAMQTGTWIELQFETFKMHNDLPFEALLIEVNENYEGINIIRKNNKTYDGRCFYLNLKSNMKNLSDKVKNISK